MVQPKLDRLTTWSRELLAWWRHYNRVYAGGALREPALRISAENTRLGSWTRDVRVLTIAESHIAGDPWLAVMATLRHEMAHQYVDEVLGIIDEPPHGPSFSRACQQLRVDGDPTASSGDNDGINARVQKLLSLGSSPNENEAQVAVAKARELLLKYNLSEVLDHPGRRFVARWLGQLKGRHAHWEQLLGGLLGEFFFVSVIWSHSFDAARGKRGTVLEVCGTPANVDMAEYVYAYLRSLLPHLWAGYRDDRALRGNRDRMRYYAGVVSGFREKLRSQDQVLRTRHALVWKGDPELDAYTRFRHPHTRTGYTGSATGDRAYTDGVTAGRSVELRRPLGDAGGHGGYLTADNGAST